MVVVVVTIPLKSTVFIQMTKYHKHLGKDNYDRLRTTARYLFCFLTQLPVSTLTTCTRTTGCAMYKLDFSLSVR